MIGRYLFYLPSLARYLSHVHAIIYTTMAIARTPLLPDLAVGTNLSRSHSVSPSVVSKKRMCGRTRSVRASRAIFSWQGARLDHHQYQPNRSSSELGGTRGGTTRSS